MHSSDSRRPPPARHAGATGVSGDRPRRRDLPARAYDAGAIPGSWITDAARSILNTPRTAWRNDCVSYSANPPEAPKALMFHTQATLASSGLMSLFDQTPTTRQDAWHNMATVEPMSLFEAAGGQKQVWPGHDVNLALLEPGIDYLTCAEAENTYDSVYARANTPYSKQIDRLHTPNAALGFAMLVINHCP